MTAFNAIDVYAEAGFKAGEARKQHDEARARFHSDWARRAINLESGEYREKAQAAFKEAYARGAQRALT
jgi:hypothetical protein